MEQSDLERFSGQLMDPTVRPLLWASLMDQARIPDGADDTTRALFVIAQAQVLTGIEAEGGRYA